MSLALRSSPESTARFDALDYVVYLRRHLGFILTACTVAVVSALVAGFLTPKRYASAASILIEPPAGSDPRTLTAVSPIYLESLRTYETFAASDTLFKRALEKFNLRQTLGSQPIEVIKARVLKVSKLRDTKILQISVTLENAQQAQAMAQFMAQETVNLISSVSRTTGSDLLEDLRKQAEEAKAKMEAALAETAQFNSRRPVATLRTELDSAIELLYHMRRELYDAEGAAAMYDSPGTKARAELLAKRVQTLEQSVSAKSATLAGANARLQRLESEQRVTQAGYEAAMKRLQDLNTWAGSSGERLRIIDPGIVPERPASPRIGLYAGVAFGVALLGSIVFLTFRYGFMI